MTGSCACNSTTENAKVATTNANLSFIALLPGTRFESGFKLSRRWVGVKSKSRDEIQRAVSFRFEVCCSFKSQTLESPHPAPSAWSSQRHRPQMLLAADKDQPSFSF